jgi:S1-C subfamily serine protease
MKNKKNITKNLILFILIFQFFTIKLAHSVDFDNSIFDENLNKNITRGAGSIGDYSINENFTKINVNNIVLQTFDILEKIKDNKNKTRGSVGQNVYSKYSKSVVLIYNNDLKGTGSGSIIIKEHGAILTNWHVIQGAKVVGIIFKNEGEIKKSDIQVASVIGYDATRDLAILQLDGKVPDDVNEIKLSTKLPEVGSDVHAIGHPGSLSWTYTKGYVSQIRKSYKWNYDKTLHEASIIQTQTPISPGNSGGPLLNSEGELLGVNSFKAPGENLNFAVTSLEVINFLQNIKKIGKKEAETKKENKKIDKVVKKIDSDNDGKPDTFYYDDNGDGNLDTVVKDSNQNGKPEMIGVDTNKDGKPDIVALDKNEDGKIDFWYVDKDFDGKTDVKGIDTDGDGKPDKFSKI